MAPPIQYNATEHVDQLLRDHQVVIFSILDCPHCLNAKNLLEPKSENFWVYWVDMHRHTDILTNELRRRTQGFPTFPMIFIDGEFQGGFSDVEEMDADGTLAEKLSKTSQYWITARRDEEEAERLEQEAWAQLPEGDFPDFDPNLEEAPNWEKAFGKKSHLSNVIPPPDSASLRAAGSSSHTLSEEKLCSSGTEHAENAPSPLQFSVSLSARSRPPSLARYYSMVHVSSSHHAQIMHATANSRNRIRPEHFFMASTVAGGGIIFGLLPVLGVVLARASFRQRNRKKTETKIVK